MPLFALTWRGPLQFSFFNRGSTCSLGDNGHQPRLKGLLYAFRIGCNQTVFGAENPMRPIRSLFGRVPVLNFASQLVA